MNTDDAKVSAFPTQDSFGYYHGMTLRDYFAGQETLSDYDSIDAVFLMKAAEAFAGPKPKHGWNAKTAEEWIAINTWEATWRAKLKYIRADAMLAAREASK